MEKHSLMNLGSFLESGLGGRVGRAGRTTRNPWADFKKGFLKKSGV